MTWLETKSTLLAELLEHRPLGLISDMDGTLSPIVSRPDAATITPRSREYLIKLAEQLDLVAIVSGRAADDLRTRVGLPQLVYVGNHGMERWQDDHVEVRPDVALYRRAMQAALDDLQPHLQPDMLLEAKDITASLHYRQVEDPVAVREAIEPVVEEIAARHGLRISPGRMIIEILPPVDIHKGTAFRELVAEYGLKSALFIGDDTTDANALRAAQAMRRDGECYAVAVGVASPETPDSVRVSSDVLVPGIKGVEDFLEWLLNATSASVT